MVQDITKAELERLRSAKNETEWNAACDDIKRAHGGYPHDWWSEVMESGLAAEVAEKWGQPDAFDIKTAPLDLDGEGGSW